MKSSLVTRNVERWTDGLLDIRRDDVAEEVPVALEYNGISHAVMLATPSDLEDFALGFSLSEGILRRREELHAIDIVDSELGIQIKMSVSAEAFGSFSFATRSLTGRTGCGICGVENLQQAIRIPHPVPNRFRMDSAKLHLALDSLRGHQELQRRTGATHAAAWIDGNGSILVVREDVGRHNALDKMIGALCTKNTDFSAGAAIITSRASYEMVQKSSTVGVEFLAAVSAPTNLAVELAETTGLTLVGFARHGGHAVYANSHRIHAERDDGGH